jgi:hypothetical protein
LDNHLCQRNKNQQIIPAKHVTYNVTLFSSPEPPARPPVGVWKHIQSPSYHCCRCRCRCWGRRDAAAASVVVAAAAAAAAAFALYSWRCYFHLCRRQQQQQQHQQFQNLLLPQQLLLLLLLPLLLPSALPARVSSLRLHLAAKAPAPLLPLQKQTRDWSGL